MSGRVKRKLALAASRRAAETAPQRCALCDRPLGARLEWHHVVPKSQGGRETVPVHPICHRALHANATNAELAADGDLLVTREREGIARFLHWIADKPPDFHAATRRAGR